MTIALFVVIAVLTFLSTGTETEKAFAEGNKFIFFSKGWNFFAFPATPIERDPEELFKGIDIKKGNLYSFNPHVQKDIIYDLSPNSFGPINQSLGYWIRVDNDTTLRYHAIDTYRIQNTWMHKGMNAVAYPYETCQPIANIKLKNQRTNDPEITFAEAREQGIVDATLYSWTNDQYQGLVGSGLEEDFYTDNYLLPGHAYWVNGFQDDYDIIIEKPTVTYDCPVSAQ